MAMRTSTPPDRRLSTGDPGNLAAFQHLVGEIFRLNGRLIEVAEALAKDLGVTPTHWSIIAIIRDRPMTVSQISRRIGLRRQSVQHNVGRLLERDFVRLADNPDHQRASLVDLTPAGRRLLKALQERQGLLTESFTRNLDLDAVRIEALADALRQIHDAAT